MIVVVALSITIFTATASVLSGLSAAPSAYVSGQGFVVMSTTAPTIFSSHVDADMVSTLEGVPNITGVSPEVFALASWNGMSFVMRGAVLDKLNATGPEIHDLRIAQGETVGERNSAIVGARLLDKLGFDLPYVLPVTGSYSSKLDFLRVVGWFETGSPMDDEIIVSLDEARFLSGTPSTKVSIIRIATSEPEWLSEVLSPSGPRFTLFDMYTQKSTIATGEDVSVSVGVRNWGTAFGSTAVRFSDGTDVLSQIDVSLNASEVKHISHNFSTTTLGVHPLTASILGDFPVALSMNVTVVEPFMRLYSPARVPLGDSFNATVLDHLGRPVEGATASFMNQTKLTDSYGNATFDADSLGSFELSANHTGLAKTAATVVVFDPAAYPAEFIPSVVQFTLSPDSVKESQLSRGVVVVENAGTLSGLFNVTVFVDSSPHLTIQVQLGSLESKSVSFSVTNIGLGTHYVQVGTFSETLTVQSWIADNPDLVQLAIKYSGSSELLSAGAIPIYQAAKISEGNVQVALIALGGISALLATLAIVSVFAKEVREGRRTLGILRTIGASNGVIRGMIFPQALRAGLAGAAIGVVLGLAISEFISRTGALYLFGHELTLQVDAGLLVTILGAAVGLSIVSALASASIATRETAIASIRRLPEPPGEPLDVDALLGED